jgi:IMP and pyridine-specific 5'-nucleotidase
MQKQNFIVLGGEANYLFKFSEGDPDRLKPVSRNDWLLDEMRLWQEDDITQLLDLAELALKGCVKNFRMDAQVLRKDRAVGIIPQSGQRFSRETLEETVLVVQKLLEVSPVGRRIPFCAFNGGNDVFVDIGDKSFGVRVCQKFFHGIDASKTLHVGDQFLSAGANDFKARTACTTAWIANPRETVQLLDEIAELHSILERKNR